MSPDRNAEGSCPNSYVYEFDQGSGTALWTCNSTLSSDYRLTFCPCVYPVFTTLYFGEHMMRSQTANGRPIPFADLGRAVIAHPDSDGLECVGIPSSLVSLFLLTGLVQVRPVVTRLPPAPLVPGGPQAVNRIPHRRYCFTK